MIDVPALILAGGLGTRLRAVLPGLPKILAPVRGRPFLSYLLDQLQAAGVREVVLCTGHRADQVFDTFGGATRSSRCGIRPNPGRWARQARSARRLDWSRPSGCWCSTETPTCRARSTNSTAGT